MQLLTQHWILSIIIIEKNDNNKKGENAMADLYFDFSWLPKAQRVVSIGIAASPWEIICLEFQPFSRRTLDSFYYFWDFF